MRAFIYVVLALLSCSCSTVLNQPCGDQVPRLGPHGVTLISDIDDTIKDTHVKLGGSHVPNPVIVLDGFRPWYPVAGMAALYRQKWGPFSEDGKTHQGRKTIIYVSAGPCRYGRRLEHSITKWEFPRGAIVLREGGIIAPHDYKTRAIQPIIKNSQGHHFVLVGDSGEFDPECYGELAREFPQQVDQIYIRNISRDTKERYDWAFRGIAKRKIQCVPAPSVAARK
jgi:phosphatidate phosphatase APP1